MAPKQKLEDLKKAKEAADKAYAEALEAGRKEAIADIHKIIADNALPMSALVTAKEQALTVATDLVNTYGLTAGELGLKVGKTDKAPSASGTGDSIRGPQAAPFKKDGKEIKWAAASKDVPADVQAILDIWKSGKPIKEYIAVTDRQKLLNLIVRIEKNTKHGTKAQLDEFNFTREQVDKRAALLNKDKAAA